MWLYIVLLGQLLVLTYQVPLLQDINSNPVDIHVNSCGICSSGPPQVRNLCPTYLALTAQNAVRGTKRGYEDPNISSSTKRGNSLPAHTSPVNYPGAGYSTDPRPIMKKPRAGHRGGRPNPVNPNHEPNDRPASAQHQYVQTEKRYKNRIASSRCSECYIYATRTLGYNADDAQKLCNYTSCYCKDCKFQHPMCKSCWYSIHTLKQNNT